MELNDILYEKKAGIAIATFNRPAALYAFRSCPEPTHGVCYPVYKGMKRPQFDIS
jgi:1,4-dihydroxy-2-naphthoyl-CoA synthase